MCTLFTGQRKRERKNEREREKEREKEKVREKEGEGEREVERVLHAPSSRKCGRAQSIPHSVSQSVSMRDYIIYKYPTKLGVMTS